MNIQTIKTKIIPILKTQGVIKAAIFGSYFSGKAKKNSDVDLLVEFSNRKSLYDIVGLKLDLERVLKKEVDLLTYKSIYPQLRDIILNQQLLIYEKRP